MLILGILSLLVSLAISSMAIYFSVSGWMALFAAASTGVMLMFGSIEIGKLIAAGFLHWHWKKIPMIHRITLLSMVLITMLLTSIGIFGYLSKGHLDQEIPASNAILQIERIDQQIESANRQINDANSKLTELQSIIDTLIEYDKISGPDGARAVRKNQEEERQFLKKQIDESIQKIDDLQNKKLQYRKEVQDVEAKLGPLQYVIDILHIDNKNLAVQLVIIASIFVFDPFAIALLLAALWSFQEVGKPKTVETEPITEKPEPIEEIEQETKIEEPTIEVDENLLEQIQEFLREQPDAVDEVEKEVLEKTPQLAKDLQESFDMARNELRIKKQGWLSNILKND